MFINHGQRCSGSEIEQERKRVDNKIDDPLTCLGVSQGHVTGRYLKMWLRNGVYDKITIESSPFLRTLQTAAIIAEELGVEEVKVNYKAFEWLNDHQFKNMAVMETLTLVKSSVEEEDNFFAERGYPGIRLNHNREDLIEILKRYPEKKRD